MWLDILLVSVWGGIVALDTTAALQIMISRPLVSCSVAGLLLGNMPVGFIVGVLLELVYISELPVGAARFSEGNVGSTIAAVLAILTLEQVNRPIIVISFCLILGIILSMLGGYLVEIMRKVNGRIYNKVLGRETLNINKVSKAQLTGVLSAFLLGFLLTLISAALLATRPLPYLIAVIPDASKDIFRPISGAFLGAGCVFLFNLLKRENKYSWVVLAGLIIGTLYFI